MKQTNKIEYLHAGPRAADWRRIRFCKAVGAEVTDSVDGGSSRMVKCALCTTEIHPIVYKRHADTCDAKHAQLQEQLATNVVFPIRPHA